MEPKPFYEVFTTLHPKYVVQCASGDGLSMAYPIFIVPKPFHEVFTNLHPKHVVQCVTGDALTMAHPNVR